MSSRTYATSIAVSHNNISSATNDGDSSALKHVKLAIMGKDRILRIFNLLKGKLIRKYDQSFQELVKENTPSDMDHLELGRRQATEEEIDSLQDHSSLCDIEKSNKSNFSHSLVF